VNKPTKVFIFDIGGVLDIGGERPSDSKILKGGVLPTRHIFSELRKRGYWVGLASGIHHWRSLYLANRHNIQIDIVLDKGEILNIRNSIDAYYGKGAEFYYIGHDETDPMYAKCGRMNYLHKDDFWYKFRTGILFE